MNWPLAEGPHHPPAEGAQALNSRGASIVTGIGQIWSRSPTPHCHLDRPELRSKGWKARGAEPWYELATVILTPEERVVCVAECVCVEGDFHGSLEVFNVLVWYFCTGFLEHTCSCCRLHYGHSHGIFQISYLDVRQNKIQIPSLEHPPRSLSVLPASERSG